MTARYRLTPKAREGFRQISFHVEEQFGLVAAIRVVAALEAALQMLAENPGAGHKKEELTSDERIRFWSVGPTLIAYRSHPEWVEILFIERGEMDWERLMSEDLT